MPESVADDLKRLYAEYEAITDRHVEAMGIEPLLKGAMCNLIALIQVAGDDLTRREKQVLAVKILTRIATACELEVRELPQDWFTIAQQTHGMVL